MPNNGDIVLSVGINTQDAEKSMKSFENTSKQFSAALSQVMKLPNTNLERVILKLRSAANAYGKAQRELSKATSQRTTTGNEIKDLEARIQLLNTMVKLYEALNSTNIEEGKAKEAASILQEIYSFLHMDMPDVFGGSEIRDAAINKLLTLLDKENEKLAGLREKYSKLGDTATAARGRMTQSLQEYLNAQQEVQTAFAVDIWNKPISSIMTYIAKMRDLREAFEGGEKASNKHEQALIRLRAAVTGIAKDFKNVINVIRKFIKLVGKLSGISAIIKGIKSGLDSRGIDWKTGLRYIIQYGLGFRSLFFLVRKLRSAAVDALEDMGKSIPRVQEYLDSISRSVNMLKGSLAVALAPLLKVVSALLARLAAAAIRAANAIAQFFAIITGQNVWFRMAEGVSSYTDAVNGSTKANKENTDSMKKQLAAFDDIDVLVKDTDDDLENLRGGGGGGLDGSELGVWEEVARPMSRLAELIKEAWKSDDVAKAFEEVGRYIGEYLQDGLEKLLTDFWPPLRALAEKVALAIAGTINGFFQTDAVVYFAKNIAAALNTALSTLSKYWGTVKWGDMAAKLRKSLEALIDDIEWDTLAEYFKNKLKGIIDFAFNLIGDGSWIKNLADKVGDVLYDVLTTVDFFKLGRTINTFITSVLNGISGILDKNGDAISTAISKFVSGLDLKSIIKSAGEVLFKLFKLLLREAFELLTQNAVLGTLLGAWLIAELAKFIIPMAAKTLLSNAFGDVIAAGFGEAVGSAGVSTALDLAGTSLFGLFSTSLASSFSSTAIALLLGGLFVAGVIEYVTGPAKSTFDIVNDAITQDTQTVMKNVGFTIQASEPELMETVVSIFDSLGYEIDTFGVTTIGGINSRISGLLSSLGFSNAEIITMLKNLYSTLGYDLSGFTGTTVVELSAFISDIIAKSNETSNEVSSDAEEAEANVSAATEGAKEDLNGAKEAYDKLAGASANAASAVKSNPIEPKVHTSFIDTAIGKIQTLLSLIGRANSGSISVPSVSNIKASVKNTAGKVGAVRAARGAVIPPNRPFLAMLGDQTRGTNVETPLSTITEALEQALVSTGFAGRNNSNQNIVLNIDGRTLARLTVPYNLDELNRKGYNVKILEGK